MAAGPLDDAQISHSVRQLSRRELVRQPCVYLEFPSLTDFSNYSNLADCDVGGTRQYRKINRSAHFQAALSYPQIFIRNHNFPV